MSQSGENKVSKKFGRLRLSAQGTNCGSGFDIFYDFGKTHNFVEFESKREFYFIQPWMQFPSKEYTDECMRVSIELVSRFNNYEKVQEENQNLEQAVEFHIRKGREAELELRQLKQEITELKQKLEARDKS